MRHDSIEYRRQEWEKSLTEVAQLCSAETREEPPRQLIVLKDKDGKYHCHRYFKVGGAWEVSVDAQRVDADTALKWAFNPRAVRRERDE